MERHFVDAQGALTPVDAQDVRSGLDICTTACSSTISANISANNDRSSTRSGVEQC